MRCFNRPVRMARSCAVTWSGALRIPACVALTLAIAPTAAHADPITVTYDVQVVSRFSREGTAAGIVEPFAQAFMLSMTFGSVADASGIYGRPVFSAVPLEIPPPPNGLAPQGFGSTTHIGLTGGGFVADATAGVGGSIQSDGNFTVYQVILDLRSEQLSSTPPQVISPDTFPVHLGSFGPAPLNPFNFTYNACLGVGPFGTDADSCSDAKGAATRIVEYAGTATLRDTAPAPVPEPASVLLVGGGLAVLRSTGKRRSRV